jgi:hypothetical protein
MTWSPFQEGDNRIKANEEPPHNAAPHFIEAYGVCLLKIHDQDEWKRLTLLEVQLPR